MRAVQSAELVAAGLGCQASVDVFPNLAPDGSARDVLAAIQSLSADAAVMLIGHEPGLSAVGALVVGKPDFEALGKAQAARIDDGVLRWRFAWDADTPQVIAAGVGPLR